MQAAKDVASDLVSRYTQLLEQFNGPLDELTARQVSAQLEELHQKLLHMNLDHLLPDVLEH